MNRFRLAEISKKDQFVMGYGGIRGAIAFSLVALLCEELVASKRIMFTTTVVIVMFTMFVQVGVFYGSLERSFEMNNIKIPGICMGAWNGAKRTSGTTIYS